ncbi:hypothetical protein DVH05_000748 [Phytophthora capsici]|nr:hypothetical protein DVH05_000748 [Phytophthora capsici]
MRLYVQAAPAAAKQAPSLARKRKKKNASTKRLRARKKARAAARAVAADTATVVPCSSTSLAAPDTVTVSETGHQASEAVPEVSVALQATPEAVAVATEPIPVAMNASKGRKKPRTPQTSMQLVPVPVAALREEKEASREHVVTPIPNVAKAGELIDTSVYRSATTDLTHSDTDYGSSGTNADCDSDCDMYCRIYGKNYERSKLTVTANYASTKETWQVARINDRRGDSLLEYNYQVLSRQETTALPADMGTSCPAAHG